MRHWVVVRLCYLDHHTCLVRHGSGRVAETAGIPGSPQPWPGWLHSCIAEDCSRTFPERCGRREVGPSVEVACCPPSPPDQLLSQVVSFGLKVKL